MLFQILSNLKGCQFAHLTITTKVVIPKKWGVIGVVTKRFDGQVQVGADYENKCNNELERQGDARTYVSDGLRKNCVWEVFPYVIRNTANGNKYLRFYGVETNVPSTTEYFVDGRPATADELVIIREYVKSTHKPCKKQIIEGLKKEIITRDVTFENIDFIKVGGQIYIKPQPSTLSLVG